MECHKLAGKSIIPRFLPDSRCPQEPMYILFSGGLEQAANSMTIHGDRLVRIYQPKKIYI